MRPRHDVPDGDAPDFVERFLSQERLRGLSHSHFNPERDWCSTHSRAP